MVILNMATKCKHYFMRRGMDMDIAMAHGIAKGEFPSTWHCIERNI